MVENKSIKQTLEKLAEKCWSEEATLKKLDDSGTGYYCFMLPDNISEGVCCKYQGDLIVDKVNHVRIRCEFRDKYSKMIKRTSTYLLLNGC